MGLFDRLKRSLRKRYYYSERDQALYEDMLREHFGDYDAVFHELVSPDLHIDVIPVKPATEDGALTLFTMGMGAYPMAVPPGYGRNNRAEMAIRLPTDWDIRSNDERCYWPIRLIKSLARLPIREKSWLGVYHDVDFGASFSPETELCAVLLDFFDETVESLTLTGGDRLLLYNVIPLYRSEMEFKTAHGAAALLEKLPERVRRGPLDPRRPPVL